MVGLVGQTGFFPGDCRLRELDLLGDGLPLLNRLIPWERFRPILESMLKAKPKGPGGRKPYDRMWLFKMMVLQQPHNLSDEQTEYQVRDRLSFQRFLGLGLEESVPDHTTLWLFRESLAQAKLTERLFTAFHAFLLKQLIFPAWVMSDACNLLKEVVKILLFEQDRKHKAAKIIKGIVDGLLGNMGKL